MANIAFDFLSESFLFNDENIETHYSNFNDGELNIELRKYREHIQSKLDVIRDEIQDEKEQMNISIESFGYLPNENLFKQLALYLDRIVIPDPVFEHSFVKGNLHVPMSKMIGLNGNKGIDRRKLSSDIKYMKGTTSLVANQFVKYFPVSLIHEPPKDLPILYSKNNFSDALPPDVYKLFYESAKVCNVDRSNGRLSFKLDSPLKMGTTIHISFDDDNIRNGVVYQFINSQNTDLDKITGKFTMKQCVAESISEKDFNTWVYQSINRAALKTYKDTFNELVLSKKVGGMYLAQSQFTSKLLDRSLGKENINTDLANLSMRLELPVFDKLSIDDIISVRCNHGESFHNFRTSMNSKLLELRSIVDPEELKGKIENVSYELNELQVNDVKKEYRKIIRSFGVDFAMLTGSLVTSFATGGLTLLGAVGATAKGVNDYTKYLSEVKENDGYFLWKLNKYNK
jgi:hypothetical protein